MKMPMMGALALASWLGCHTAARDPAAAQREQLVARAAQSLAASTPLDYRRPFTSHGANRPATAALYLEACRAGDRSSCWIANMLDTSLGDELVVANCRAGDVMSCRALRRDFYLVPGTPGWAGRSGRCLRPDKQAHADERARCDAEDLRRECEAGFLLSCVELRGEPGHAEAMGARIERLAREGCQAGIEDECSPHLTGDTGPARVAVAERMCPLVVTWCATLARHHVKNGDLERAREFAERACQYGHGRGACSELAKLYLEKRLPEPVPGRGTALRDWVCDSDVAMDRDPVCKGLREQAVAPRDEAPSPAQPASHGSPR